MKQRGQEKTALVKGRMTKAHHNSGSAVARVEDHV